MNDSQKILSAARAGAEKYYPVQIETLRSFCSIDCGTGNIPGNDKAVELADRMLGELGAEITHIEAPGFGHHVIGRLTPKAGSTGKILVLAHLDTVFAVGDVEKYPFGIDGDIAHGLGVADCKGGIVTSIYAVKSMQDAGLLPNKEIVFLFNCDEEVASPTAQALQKKEAEHAEYAFGFEPGRAKNGVLTRRSGVCEGSIIVEGKSAHAQMAYLSGASAVQELASLITHLYGMNDPAKEVYYNVAPISGGTRTGMVADHAEARFCASLPKDATLQQVYEDINVRLPKMGTVAGCTFTTSVKPIFLPMERTAQNVALYERVRKASELLGRELPEEEANASSDSCTVGYCGVPTVDGMGPYMYDIHTVRERMRLSTLKERTELFAAVLGMME